jgi:hypothetical protein
LPYAPGEEPGIKNPETMYSIYRDYIKHEDDLINRRQTSNVILQVFLFAAYGFSVDYLYKPAIGKDLLGGLKLLRLIIPLVGCTVGVLALMSIVAAQSAIDGLKTDWADIAAEIDPKILARLPGLTGAGKKLSNRLGKVAQVGIACIIVLTWIALWWIARQ